MAVGLCGKGDLGMVVWGCSVLGEEEDGEEGATKGWMDERCLCMAMGDKGTEAGLD